MSIGGIVDRLAKQATPEARERIKRLRMAGRTVTDARGLEVPDPHPDAVAARAEIALAVHGIHVEHWACRCGAAYVYPWSSCRTCKRDYPRRCTTPGCGVVSEVEAMVTLGGVECELVRGVCKGCTSDSERRSRAHSYGRSSIPPRERAWGALPLIAYEHQAEAMSVLESWLARGPDSRTWRRHKGELDAHLGGTCAMYLSGTPGAGKSVVAANIVHQAFVDRRLVDDFRWHSQATLGQLFAARHVGSDEQRGEALKTWDLVVETPLLVVDDLFVSVPTPAFATALASLFRERMDQMRPTVITSNHRPQWGIYLETDEVGRLDSRWYACGVELVVSGIDLRRSA